MNKTLLIIGIVITGISLLAITIFSLSNTILKRINKEKEAAKTVEQKQHDKTVKKVLKNSKKIIKKINKRLVENYVAVYIVSAVTLTGGAALTTVSAVNVVNENNASSSEPAPEPEPEPEPEPTPVPPVEVKYTVTYIVEDVVYGTQEVVSGNKTTPISPQPSKEEELFRYWSDDELYLANRFDFNTPITSNITLFAVFGQPFIVNFYDGQIMEENLVHQEIVANGEKAEYYNYVLDPNYETGWGTDVGAPESMPYDFNEPVTENIDLFAYRIINNNTTN